MSWRRPRARVVPGQPCPAVRTNSSRDKLVRNVRRYATTGLEGVRSHCGRCGLPNVKVKQSTLPNGAALQAWYYEPHIAPTSPDSEASTS